MMKKSIALLLLVALIWLSIVPRVVAVESEIEYVVLRLASVFIETPIHKKALIVDDEIYMDAGTLADLTGYGCSYWSDKVIFERGYRKIAVKPDGSVLYADLGIHLQLNKVIMNQGYTYLPLSAALRMLNSVEVVKDDSIYVFCNFSSLIDNYAGWDMNYFVFDFDRDLPIKSVLGVKIGTFMANIFDRGFTYIVNSVSGQGLNADKYRDAAIYYMTYDGENTAGSSVENEIEFLNLFLTFFGDELNEMVIEELEGLPSSLYDADIVNSLRALNVASKVNDFAQPLVNGLVMYNKLATVGSPQIQSLKASVTKPNGSSQSDLGLSLYRGVNNAIGMAEKRFDDYFLPAARDITLEIVDTMKLGDLVIEKLAGNVVKDAIGSALAGFSIGNAIMRLALNGEFEKMDKYDLVFCLKDMQDKTLRQYNESRWAVVNGSTNIDDYIYVYNAMQFLNNSNIAICTLLTEIYENDKSNPDVRSLLSYWNNRADSSRLHNYASRITLEECIRDTIPTDLANIKSSVRIPRSEDVHSIAASTYAEFIRDVLIPKHGVSPSGSFLQTEVDSWENSTIYFSIKEGILSSFIDDLNGDGIEDLLVVRTEEFVRYEDRIENKFVFDYYTINNGSVVLLDTIMATHGGSNDRGDELTLYGDGLSHLNTFIKEHNGERFLGYELINMASGEHGYYFSIYSLSKSCFNFEFQTHENLDWGFSITIHDKSYGVGTGELGMGDWIEGDETEAFLEHRKSAFSRFGLDAGNPKSADDIEFPDVTIPLSVRQKDARDILSIHSSFQYDIDERRTTVIDYNDTHLKSADLPHSPATMSINIGDASNIVEYENSRYALFDYGATWKEARTLCEDIGGRLVTITSAEEQQVVESLITNGTKNCYWLGGTDEGAEGVWKWITGEAFEYTNWDPRQPDNENGVEHYLDMFRTSYGVWGGSLGTWDDLNNDVGAVNNNSFYNLDTIGFICEWSDLSGSPSTGVVKGAFIEELRPIDSARYTGNQGDSFIDKIGTRNGNVDIHGNTHEHGLTAWVARWNYTEEISWVWNEYDLSEQYKYLRGNIVVMKGQNVDNFYTTLKIIGDGVELYSFIMTPETLPSGEISVDVTGVKMLRIEVRDNREAAGGTAFGLVDFRLLVDYDDIFAYSP